ncbi:MAG TPA: hypothetical protein VLC52_00305 [Anaerolineae bacterium]|nr:hypothetical protein [Anaerolineae bacterium]
MKRLSRQAFERARAFLKAEARPLDRALFEHRFEGAPAEVAVAELARYRNDDGGFGHALEPDARTPSSSAVATEIALRTLRKLGIEAGHPLVRGAIDYLLASHDPASRTWRAVPAGTNDHPHAPWWHDDGQGSLARTFDDFVIIPRAGIVALLHQYSAAVPGPWLAEVTEETLAGIEAMEPLGTGGGDDLVYALRLAESETLPGPARERLLARLRSVVPAVVSRDPTGWAEYSIQPLKVAPDPRSSVADLIWDELEANLDYKVATQAADGAWEPNWTWGNFYPEAWERARCEWRGRLALETLTTLRAFGRIDA